MRSDRRRRRRPEGASLADLKPSLLDEWAELVRRGELRPASTAPGRRAADDDQADALRCRCAHQTIEVRGRDLQVACDALGAGVAGGAEHLLHLRGRRDLPGQGVLAPAAAQDEDVHALIGSAACRSVGHAVGLRCFFMCCRLRTAQ